MRCRERLREIDRQKLTRETARRAEATCCAKIEVPTVALVLRTFEKRDLTQKNKTRATRARVAVGTGILFRKVTS